MRRWPRIVSVVLIALALLYLLLEPERPEHSSRVVRTRQIGAKQLRLLKTLHGKATGTQSDSSDPGHPQA